MLMGLQRELLTFMEDKGLDVKKCRGQGYDGASVIKGAYSGVQALIRNISPNADYVHCASHNLNLVLNDSQSSVESLLSRTSTPT